MAIRQELQYGQFSAGDKIAITDSGISHDLIDKHTIVMKSECCGSETEIAYVVKSEFLRQSINYQSRTRLGGWIILSYVSSSPLFNDKKSSFYLTLKVTSLSLFLYGISEYESATNATHKIPIVMLC